MYYQTVPATSLDKELLDILSKLNEKGKTVIVGGHLRNLFYGYPETNVDFQTTLSIEELREIFPRLSFTERGLEFGVCKALFKNRVFDFSLCVDEVEFDIKLNKRDFTVNSAFCDGKFIYYPGEAKKHLEEKKLVPVYSLEDHSVYSDKMLIRTYRLISEFGFSCDKETFLYLFNHKNEINSYEQFILMDEFYRIVKGAHVMKAFSYFWMIYFPEKPHNFLKSYQNFQSPLMNDNIKARLVYLDNLSTESFIPEILVLFEIDDYLNIDFQTYRKNLNEEQNIPKNELAFYLLIKRYQFNDDPVELSNFLSSFKK